MYTCSVVTLHESFSRVVWTPLKPVNFHIALAEGFYLGSIRIIKFHVTQLHHNVGGRKRRHMPSVFVALQLFDGWPDRVPQNCSSPPAISYLCHKQQVVTGV